MGVVIGAILFVGVLLVFGLSLSKSDSFKPNPDPVTGSDPNALNLTGLWVLIGAILVLGMLAMAGALSR